MQIKFKPEYKDIRKWNCVFFIFLFSILISCSSGKYHWIQEPIDKMHVSWDGSYENGIKSLKLLYHGWKIFKNENNEYEIGFRAKIDFIQSKENDSIMNDRAYSKDLLVMPVNRIIYRLYDEDDFVIDSINLEDPNKDVIYRDTNIFQMKLGIDKNKINKIKYGKIQIIAGYNLSGQITYDPWETPPQPPKSSRRFDPTTAHLVQ